MYITSYNLYRWYRISYIISRIYCILYTVYYIGIDILSHQSHQSRLINIITTISYLIAIPSHPIPSLPSNKQRKYNHPSIPSLLPQIHPKETTKNATNIHSSNPSRNSHDIYILSKPKPCHPCRRTNNKQTSEEQKRAKAKQQNPTTSPRAGQSRQINKSKKERNSIPSQAILSYPVQIRQAAPHPPHHDSTTS